MSQLALHGGPKAKPAPYTQPNRYGDLELKYVTEALRGGKLMSPSGTMVSRFEAACAAKFGAKHCILTTSGTTAIQVAFAAAGVTEGDEVITTNVCDAGTFMSILALHAVPIFADIDPNTYASTAATVEPRITPRTRAILVVHMAGIAADMDAFLALGRRHNIAIIEDCSQAHGATWAGKHVGAMGLAGAFSMNESKHMSTGDGGFILTSDDTVAWIARLYIDKTYLRGPVQRGEESVSFAALNCRPTAITAALAQAQLERLDENIARRRVIAARYYQELSDLPELHLPRLPKACNPAWWPVPVRYVGSSPTRDEIMAAIQAEGVSINSALSPLKGNVRSKLIRERRFYPLTDKLPHFLTDVHYDPNSCPQTDAIMPTVMRLPMDFRYTDEDITQTIAGIRKVWDHYYASTKI